MIRTRSFAAAWPLLALCLLLTPAARVAAASPEGQVTYAFHVTLAPRWLDPGETESAISPFKVLYAIHDALVKPMPAGRPRRASPSPGRCRRMPLSYTFVLRPNIKFHNGDAVTADDVKFSFDRYKGGAAKLLKDKVKDVQVVDPRRVKFVLKEPWPDFMTFYGTTATGAGWIVPKKYVEKVGDDGFKKAPIGAGPYKFVSSTPGVEIVARGVRGLLAKGAEREAAGLQERPRRDHAGGRAQAR